MSRRRILVVLPAVPFPARSQGISIRYYPILEHLVERWEVDLVVLDEVDRTPAFEAGIEKLCHRCLTVSPYADSDPGLVKKLGLALASLLPNTPAYDSVRHANPACLEQIDAFVAARAYDCLLWVGLESHGWTGRAYQQPLERLRRRVPHEKFVFDLVDSPTLHARRSGNRESRLARAMGAYDNWKTARREARGRARADDAIYISKTDAEVAGAIDEHVHIVPNGVFLEGHHDRVRPGVAPPTIGFLGDMSYAPNVQGALWVHEHLLGPLRLEWPELRLYLIGKNPCDAIQALASEPGVVVTGRVEDIWEWVNAIDVFALPIFIGAGQQNKILETMYAGKPVITTAIGNQGIEAGDPGEIVLADDPESARHALVTLLEDPSRRRRLGMAARRFIESRYSWARITQEFESILLRGL